MVNVRKDALVTGEIYHVFNRSIAGYRIFSTLSEFFRINEALRFYQRENSPVGLARYLEIVETKGPCSSKIVKWSTGDKIVQICAYCIMPTHIHLIIKQLKEDGASTFMGNLQNSYARYFNTKRKRKGPLWEGKFKNVLVKTDEQLLHLTRYVHLNPTTASLVDKPEDWPASSYKEYIRVVDDAWRICEYQDLLDVQPHSYREFVEDRISYQREMSIIRKLLLE